MQVEYEVVERIVDDVVIEQTNDFIKRCYERIRSRLSAFVTDKTELSAALMLSAEIIRERLQINNNNERNETNDESK